MVFDVGVFSFFTCVCRICFEPDATAAKVDSMSQSNHMQMALLLLYRIGDKCGLDAECQSNGMIAAFVSKASRSGIRQFPTKVFRVNWIKFPIRRCFLSGVSNSIQPLSLTTPLPPPAVKPACSADRLKWPLQRLVHNLSRQELVNTNKQKSEINVQRDGQSPSDPASSSDAASGGDGAETEALGFRAHAEVDASVQAALAKFFAAELDGINGQDMCTAGKPF